MRLQQGLLEWTTGEDSTTSGGSVCKDRGMTQGPVLEQEEKRRGARPPRQEVLRNARFFYV
jgi:hypothetical protein